MSFLSHSLSFNTNPFSISLLCSRPFLPFFNRFQSQLMLPPLVSPIYLLFPMAPPINHSPPFHPSNPFPLYRLYSLQTSLIPPFPSPTHTVAAENHPSKPFFLWQSLCDEDNYFCGLYLWQRQRRFFSQLSPWRRCMISFAVISMTKTKTTAQPFLRFVFQ